MLSSKKDIFNSTHFNHPTIPLNTLSPLQKSYSPINIRTLNLSPKQQITNSYSKSIISIPKAAKKQSRTKSTFPMPSYPLSVNKSTKEPSIIQTILDYKSRISTKYTKYFISISKDEHKQVEYEDILAYLRKKVTNREIKLNSSQSYENLGKTLNSLARSIMKTFDINGKLAFGLAEFLGVCSVHDIFFSDSVLNLTSKGLLEKIKDKVDELKKSFDVYDTENGTRIDYLVSIVNTMMSHKDRRSFLGYIKSSNVNFTLYLQILPVFLNLEHFYF